MKPDILIHGNHNRLISAQYLQERIEIIKERKPEFEHSLRLRLIKKLPPEAISEIPENVMKSLKVYCRAQRKYLKEWMSLEVTAKGETKGKKKADEALEKHDEILASWSLKNQKKFHDKWCGCKQWNGREIVFPKKRKTL